MTENLLHASTPLMGFLTLTPLLYNLRFPVFPLFPPIEKRGLLIFWRTEQGTAFQTPLHASHLFSLGLCQVQAGSSSLR